MEPVRTSPGHPPPTQTLKSPAPKPKITFSGELQKGRDWVVFVVSMVRRLDGPGAWTRAILMGVGALLLIIPKSIRCALIKLGVFKKRINMFFQESDFPFISVLESNWETIRSEYEALEGRDFIAWPEKEYHGQGWDIFAFYTFGVPLGKNCKLCPETARLVKQIPGMATAVFSKLSPGVHIAPHRGEPAGLLRYHLGLVVPDGCALRVGPETRTVRERGSMIFDDTTDHEAWNKSDRTRVVLLVDLKHPRAKQGLKFDFSTLLDFLKHR